MFRSDPSKRIVASEILDDLPETDPRAVASRRDLRRLNRIMLQDRLMATLLATFMPAPPRRILEIGCGDGSFMLSVARRLPATWRGVQLVLLDRQNLVQPQRIDDFAAMGWRVDVVQDDVFAWAANENRERYDLVSTNLFLHHFRDPELVRLFGAMAALAPLLVATEPWRAGFPLLSSRMVGLIGANDVTRHDAPASVRAGFRGQDLSVLWPGGPNSVLLEGRRGLFTHAFVAKGSAP